MNKKNIITILLVLVTMAGQAQSPIPESIVDTYWRNEVTGDWEIGFTESCAISVYTLCKRAREYGFFSSDFPDFPNGKAELEQLKRDIAQMKANAKTDTIRNYLQMAIAELDKIK